MIGVVLSGKRVDFACLRHPNLASAQSLQQISPGPGCSHLIVLPC